MLITEIRKIYTPVINSKTYYIVTTYALKSGEIKLINPKVLDGKYVINNESGYIEFENVDEGKCIEFEYDAYII